MVPNVTAGVDVQLGEPRREPGTEICRVCGKPVTAPRKHVNASMRLPRLGYGFALVRLFIDCTATGAPPDVPLQEHHSDPLMYRYRSALMYHFRSGVT